MDLTPKQQTSEAIRQAESILITTGQHPTIDQATAVLALASILRKFGKKVTAVVSDPMPQQLGFLGASGLDSALSGQRDFILKIDVTKTELDKLRYEIQDGKLNIFISPFKGGFAPSDVTFDYGDFHYDIAIVLGVPTRARIDNIYAKNQSIFNSIPVINIDFHRSNENYGAINLIEPMASSLCEILVATSESLQSGLIDADIATVMLTGLMSSTDRFTATHTTSKSLTVAAQLMAAGARQQAVVKGLFRDSRDGQNRPERAEFKNTPYVPKPKAQAEPQAAAPAQDRPAPQPIEPAIATMPEAAPKAEASLALPKAEPLRQSPNNVEPADEPIIEPAHIELSEMDYVGEGADEGVELQATDNGEYVPMADFAAAAEILKQRRAELENDDVVE